MVETCVGPSELHLKKELSALRKARFLRDPETCSSWRSPLSSRSAAAPSNLNYGNGIRGYSTGANNSAGLFEVESNCSLPLRTETRQNKVYLYNWGHHSSKASESGIKLDGENSNKRGSVEGSLEDSPDNHVNAETYLEGPVPVFSVRGTNLEKPVRRTVRKLRRSAVSKHCVIRNSALSKLLDLPSSSLGAVDSVEQSDDNEYCNSEDLWRSTQDLIRKTGYASSSASPLFSRSGCGKWSRSSKILRNTRQDESSYSCTPASTSSFNRYGHQNRSTVGSWDGATTSFDGDEMDQMEIARSQGCGIPCYSSKRMKDRSSGGWCSPSLSDTLRRKGSSILCGSQALYHSRRSSAKHRSSGFHKQKPLPEASQGLPLLTNGCDGGRSSVDTSSDGLSTNYGELDLEALSRLDGRRWSNFRSQEGLELTLPVNPGGELPENRSLSQKYRPRSFDEIVGQKIVVQSLQNAILRGRIAPAYLFQGPRGTGKTSAARVFAAALNCLSTEENKPCGFCKECTNFVLGNGSNMREVDAIDKKGIDRIRHLLKKKKSTATSFSQYMVFVIDECHMLSFKVWSALIKFLEEPPLRVVFVFITIDPDNLPHTILSRCQKYLFPKIKDADIVSRLGKLSASESLDTDLDALELIALNSEGSLRDAETMLDQLSLLGKRITTSMVNDIVGVVSDEKLLDLLEIAMSSDTAETVRRSKEMMDSGVDPMALMSQLAGLIMDIIAGTYQLTSSKSNDQVGGQSLTDAELDRLHQALKFLSDAEKQLRLSSERATWFTAALLQLGSVHSSKLTRSTGSSSNKQSFGKMQAGTVDRTQDALFYEKSDSLLKTLKLSSASSGVVNGHSSPHANPSSHMLMREVSSNFSPAVSQSINLLAATDNDKATSKRYLTKINLNKLDEIWQRCIDMCHSKTLRLLLSNHGRLISISEDEGVLVAVIAFGDDDIKFRVERFLSSITDSMEIVLGYNVEVRIGSLLDNHINTTGNLPDSLAMGQTDKNGLQDKERKTNPNNSNSSSGNDTYKEPVSLPRKSVDSSDGKLQRTPNISESFGTPNERVQLASLSSEGNGACGSKEKGLEVQMRKKQRAAIDEQRLESAWLQAVEKGTPGLATSLKADRNQILPQNGISHQSQNESMMALAASSEHWEDELNHEIKALKISDSQGHQKEHMSWRAAHYAVSPSLLHSNNFQPNFEKENPESESGLGCNGFLCWKTSRPHGGKEKERTHVHPQKTGRLLCFGHYGKSKAIQSRIRR